MAKELVNIQVWIDSNVKEWCDVESVPVESEVHPGKLAQIIADVTGHPVRLSYPSNSDNDIPVTNLQGHYFAPKLKA